MKNLFKVIFHAVVMALLFVLPIILSVHPAWLDYSVGGLLNSLYLWLVSTQASPLTVGFRRR